MIKIIKSSDTEELRRLREKLSINEGIVTQRSKDLTLKVFGKPLSPREVVQTIIQDVRSQGTAAVLKYESLLDGAQISERDLRVTSSEIRKAVSRVPKNIIKALEKAASNIRKYQEAIKYKFKKPVRSDGMTINLKVMPLESAGLYIPGGTALYPSSVLMNAIPAKVAGVSRIVMATPPSPEGKIDDRLLAAASISGVTDIYRIGGVQALAAMAFGTGTIPKVCKIAGPGNLFVALAKKELYGTCDIDMIAGPSEVLIIADDSADPAFLAFDLMAQAEHYPGSAVLLTPSGKLADSVNREISNRVKGLGRSDRILEDLRDFSLIVITKNLDEAVRISDDFAPEHLQVMTGKPEKLAALIRNAGAVFVGPYTPVTLGDYFAGPSHTLPTGGTAKFFSGVNVNDFLRTSAFMSATRSYVRKYGTMIESLAEAEGLTAHKESVRIRR
jgi:histidinol dehydrogenase